MITRMNLNSTVALVGFGTVLAGVLLVSSVRAELRPKPPPRSPATTLTPWSEDEGDEDPGSGVPRGPMGHVTLLHDRNEYLLGENILIHYRLENPGTEPLPYEKGGFYPGLRRNDGYTITAVPVDQNGKQIGPPLEGIPKPQNFGGPDSAWTLKPGEAYEQTLYLPRYLRLDKPGRYRVRIVNGDRMDAERRFATGLTTITLKLPSPQEARAVYQRMKKLPREPVAGISERRDRVIADFEAMLHPVYLPILLEYARKGDRDALPSIGKMHTVESTQALIALVEQGLRADDVNLSLAAYGRMGERLPNPRFYLHGDNVVMPEYYAPQRRFVERVWRPAFAAPLRRLAARLARDPEAKALGTISFIYECVGTAEDMPDLIRGYTKSIEATKTLPFETHQYFRPRGSAYGYRFSTRQLLGRGAKVPTAPQTPGAAAVYLIAMQMRNDFRPADWPEQVTRWLKYETPYLREFVLEHMPEPIPEGALEMLPELLAHDYVDLQIAACHTAKKHPREACRKPILAILQTETEKNLLNAAASAGPANGITNDRIMEVWLDRMDNDEQNGKWVVRLLLTILEDNQARSQKKLDPEITKATKARWGRFIQEHREKLRKGHRFKLGDPEITADLFPPGFRFYFKGKPWPAN